MVLSYPVQQKLKKTYYDFGYYLGRVIYLIDALDDYKKDMKKGKFNPFRNYRVDKNTTDIETEVFLKAVTSLEFSYRKLRNSMKGILKKENSEIITNVIELGIPAQINRIIASQYIEESKKVGEKYGIHFDIQNVD